ncbi:MAG: A/G-specific adenine glycosylase [Planctomycetales bacterium]|nr:A/G-specific adenine glycosylase [Planctomycetales bacterium]
MSDSPAPSWVPSFRKKLLPWYAHNRRDLPWRRTTNPYAIWLSEVMLQQTQVATVIDYYYRFLQRFPDVQTLADAEEETVLKLWAGLGYYRRARQLHAAAKMIVNQHGGVFPRDVEGLRGLPGVGRYTAGAIASFAWGLPAPIVEANTLRLYSRLMALEGDPRGSGAQKKLWTFAESLLPQQGPNIGRVNQATMELGSLVCLPQQPDCGRCPVTAYCLAHQQGRQAEIPQQAKPPLFIPVQHGLVVIRHRGRFLMRRNPAGGWWEGLWDFPRVDVSQPRESLAFDPAAPARQTSRRLVELNLQRELGLACHAGEHLRTMKHGVTRYRIALFCFKARLVRGEAERLLNGPSMEWKWVAASSQHELPLTSTAQKLWKWLATTNATTSLPRPAQR